MSAIWTTVWQGHPGGACRSYSGKRPENDIEFVAGHRHSSVLLWDCFRKGSLRLSTGHVPVEPAEWSSMAKLRKTESKGATEHLSFRQGHRLLGVL